MPRSIHITPVLNGFVCKVDCTAVVVTSLDALCAGIRDYYTNPRETEKRWLSSGINRDETTGQCEAQAQTVNQVAGLQPVGSGLLTH